MESTRTAAVGASTPAAGCEHDEPTQLLLTPRSGGDGNDVQPGVRRIPSDTKGFMLEGLRCNTSYR